ANYRSTLPQCYYYIFYCNPIRSHMRAYLHLLREKPSRGKPLSGLPGTSPATPLDAHPWCRTPFALHSALQTVASAPRRTISRPGVQPLERRILRGIIFLAMLNCFSTPCLTNHLAAALALPGTCHSSGFLQ